MGTIPAFLPIPNDARAKAIVKDVRRVYNTERFPEIPGLNHKWLKGAPNNCADLLGVPYPGNREPPVWRLSRDHWEWSQPNQRGAVAMFARQPGLIVSHPTGTGKTFTSIACIAASGAPRVLIVTPTRVIRNYRKALQRFAPFVPYTILQGQTAAPPEEWRFEGPRSGPARVAIVSWANLPAWTETLGNTWALEPGAGGSALVLDESHRAKSKSRWFVEEDAEGNTTFRYNSSWAGSCTYLSRRYTRRLLLTATPQSTDRADWWAQNDYAEPDAWGSYRDFTTQYCEGSTGEYGWDATGASCTDEFQSRMVTLQHHVPKSVLPLPELRVHFERIPRDKLDIPAANASLPKRIGSNSGKQQEALIAYAAAAKRPWVLENVARWSQAGGRTTIFTNRKEEVLRVALALKAVLGSVPVYYVNGDSKDDEIDAVLEKYTDTTTPGPAVLVSTSDLPGEGVDGLHLVTTNAVFQAIPYTPRQLVQALGRFHRLEGLSADVWVIWGEGLIDEGIVDILAPRLREFNTMLAGDETLESLSAAMSDEGAGLKRMREKLVATYALGGM